MNMPDVSTSFAALHTPRGIALLRDPLLNKGTGFTEQERDALGLRGLLPAHLLTLEQQAERVLSNLRRLPNDLEKYVALNALHLRVQRRCPGNGGRGARRHLLGIGRDRRQALRSEAALPRGGGEAATGIADPVVAAMVAQGCPEADARRRNWLVDSRGLVVKARSELAEHKLAYAHGTPRWATS
jgi:Malic enzyme, NAD binding domain